MLLRADVRKQRSVQRIGNTDATGNLYKRSVREAGRTDSQTIVD